MPLFGKTKKNKQNAQLATNSHDSTHASSQPSPEKHKKSPGHTSNGRNGIPESQGSLPAVPPEDIRKPKYKFHCQLAHGSPTGIITGFTNVKELYKKIAESYSIDPKEIIFCTLNTHKIEMDHLLGGQIALDDFIFAHVKGQKKEIDVVKSEDALGLTITDNGAGYAFIKRIKADSVMDNVELVETGDLIESIDHESFIGKRHFDVAKRLKEIAKNTTFTIRLVSPEKTAFAMVAPRGTLSTGKSSAGISSGKKTIRLKADGTATEQDAPDQQEECAIKAISNLVESVLGIDDREIAQRIWEIGQEQENPHNFSVCLDQEMGEFGFADDLIFDFWGVVTDAKAGRLKNEKSAVEPVNFYEQF